MGGREKLFCHRFAVKRKIQQWNSVENAHRTTDNRYLCLEEFSWWLSRIQGFPGSHSICPCHTPDTSGKPSYGRLDIWDSGLDSTHQIISESAHISFPFGGGDNNIIWDHSRVNLYGNTRREESHALPREMLLWCFYSNVLLSTPAKFLL